MNRFQLFELLEENEALIPDGFEEAVVGCGYGANVVAVLDAERIVNILIEKEGMDMDDAIEHMDYNIVGSYVGEKTPLYVVLDSQLYAKLKKEDVHDD